MSIARHPSFGRRRRYAAQRLVRQLQQRSFSDEQVQRLTAFHNGLRAVELLKRHFPDHYRTYASRQITLPFLARITELFLKLAHQHLIYIEETEWEINLDGQVCLEDPAQLADDEAESLLLENLSSALFHPFPYFYGFSRDWEDLFGRDNTNILLAAVWTMLHDTAWRYAEVVHDDYSPDQCFPEFPDSALAVITGLVKLPAGTPMPELCRYLNQQAFTIDESKPPLARLGDIICYCVHQTGNEFADYGSDVIYEDYGGAIGFDWFSSDEELAENRAAQRGALGICKSYVDLGWLVQNNPALLQTLNAVLIQAAAQIAANPSLVDEEDAAEDSSSTTPALEAPMSPPQSAPQRPWQRLRPKPVRLPQEQILIGRTLPEAQLSIFPSGLTLLSRRDGTHGWRCYPVEPAAVASSLAQLPASTGALLPNTIATGWAAGKPWFLIYVPPHQRLLRALLQHAERGYQFQLPPLIWFGYGQSFRIWALPEIPAPGTYPAPDTMLCAAPFPNCRADGAICWGGSSPPTVTTCADLLPALELFLAGSYFNTHAIEDKSRAFPVSVLAQWSTLAPSQPYPLADLVATNISLEMVTTAKIR